MNVSVSLSYQLCLLFPGRTCSERQCFLLWRSFCLLVCILFFSLLIPSFPHCIRNRLFPVFSLSLSLSLTAPAVRLSPFPFFTFILIFIFVLLCATLACFSLVLFTSREDMHFHQAAGTREKGERESSLSREGERCVRVKRSVDVISMSMELQGGPGVSPQA